MNQALNQTGAKGNSSPVVVVNAKRSKCQTSKVILRYVNLKGWWHSRDDGKVNYEEGKQLVIVKWLDQMKDVYLL